MYCITTAHARTHTHIQINKINYNKSYCFIIVYIILLHSPDIFIHQSRVTEGIIIIKKQTYIIYENVICVRIFYNSK